MGARKGGLDLEGAYSPVLSDCQEEGEQGWSDRRVEEWRERGKERQKGGGGGIEEGCTSRLTGVNFNQT